MYGPRVWTRWTILKNRRLEGTGPFWVSLGHINKKKSPTSLIIINYVLCVYLKGEAALNKVVKADRVWVGPVEPFDQELHDRRRQVVAEGGQGLVQLRLVNCSRLIPEQMLSRCEKVGWREMEHMGRQSRRPFPPPLGSCGTTTTFCWGNIIIF